MFKRQTVTFHFSTYCRNLLRARHLSHLSQRLSDRTRALQPVATCRQIAMSPARYCYYDVILIMTSSATEPAVHAQRYGRTYVRTHVYVHLTAFNTESTAAIFASVETT